jgi:hypothetical protein
VTPEVRAHQTAGALVESANSDHAAVRARRIAEAAANATVVSVERPGDDHVRTVEENRALAKAQLVHEGKVMIRSAGKPQSWAIRDPDGNTGIASSASGITVRSVQRPGDGIDHDAEWQRQLRAEDDELFRQNYAREHWAALGVADGPVVELPPGLEGMS